jgi:hypothetical protein
MNKTILRNGDVILGTVKYADIPQKMFVKTDNRTAEILAEKLNTEGVRFSAVLRAKGEATVTVNADFIKYAEEMTHKINASFQPKYTAEKPTFQDILKRFQNVKQVHGSQFIANCPCCQDTKQHLYIKENNVGVALDCKRGCSSEQITSAVGLKMSDLFTSQAIFNPGVGYVPRQTTPSSPKEQPKYEQLPVVAWRRYNYSAVTGEKLQKNIGIHENGDKFAVWKHHENGRYEKGLNGLTPTLYRAENISKSDLIFIVEGEKDVHTMEKMGFTAVCSPHGSKWNDSYAPLFKGKNVVIITDFDKPGMKYGRDIVDSLSGKNGERIAKQGVLLPANGLLPTLKEKGDISDIVAEKGEDFAKNAILQRVNKYFPKEISTVSISRISQITENRNFSDNNARNYIEKEEMSV